MPATRPNPLITFEEREELRAGPLTVPPSKAVARLARWYALIACTVSSIALADPPHRIDDLPAVPLCEGPAPVPQAPGRVAFSVSSIAPDETLAEREVLQRGFAASVLRDDLESGALGLTVAVDVQEARQAGATAWMEVGLRARGTGLAFSVRLHDVAEARVRLFREVAVADTAELLRRRAELLEPVLRTTAPQLPDGVFASLRRPGSPSEAALGAMVDAALALKTDSASTARGFRATLAALRRMVKAHPSFAQGWEALGTAAWSVASWRAKTDRDGAPIFDARNALVLEAVAAHRRAIKLQSVNGPMMERIWRFHMDVRSPWESEFWKALFASPDVADELLGGSIWARARRWRRGRLALTETLDWIAQLEHLQHVDARARARLPRTEALLSEMLARFEEPFADPLSGVRFAELREGYSTIRAPRVPAHRLIDAVLRGGVLMANTRDAAGWNTMHHAAARGDIVALRQATLAERGAMDDFGETPLHVAAAAGRIASVETLLDEGTPVDARDHVGRSALHLGAATGNVEAIHALLARGASARAQTIEGQTPLHVAVATEELRAVAALLGCGYRSALNLEDSARRTPLALALDRANARMLQLFEKAGIVQGEWGARLLLAAQRDGKDDRAALLRKHGARIDAITAVIAGTEEILAAALQQPGAAAARDHQGWTALHHAAARGKHRMAQQLINAGAEVDSRTVLGRTPLHLAALADSAAAVQVLIAAKATLDPRDVDGATPLVLAGERAADELLAAGADRTARDVHGREWSAGRGGHANPSLFELFRFPAGSFGVGITGIGRGSPGGGTAGFIIERTVGQLIPFNSEEPIVNKLFQHVARLYTGGYFPEAEWRARDAAREAVRDSGPGSHDAAAAKHNLARVLRFAGNLREAEPLARNALAQLEKTAHIAWIAAAHRTMARLDTDLGRYADAERRLRRALMRGVVILDNVDIERDATWLMLADLAVEAGRYVDARRLYQRVLVQRRRYYDESAENMAGYAAVVHNLGVLYHRLGNLARAERSYGAAAEIYKRLLRQYPEGDGHGFQRVEWTAELATASINQAEVQRARGDLASAGKLLRRTHAMTVAQFGREDPVAVAAAIALARVELSRGSSKRAAMRLVATERTIERIFGPLHPHLAVVLALRSLAASKGPRHGDAMELAARAVEIAELAESPGVRWTTHATAARVLEAGGNRRAAIFFGSLALGELQRLRGEVRRLGDAAEGVFLATGDRGDTYREQVDRLVAEGRLAEAQEVLALLKQDEYVQLVRGGTPSDAPTAAAAPAGHYAAAREGLVAHARELRRLRERARSQALSPAEQVRVEALDSELTAARRTFRGQVAEVIETMSTSDVARARDVAARNLPSLRALQTTLEKLGPGAVALHYVVLPARVRILLTTPDAQVARDFVISEVEFNRKLHAFRTALGNPQSDASAPARALYEVLVAPIASDLEEAEARVLMLSLDGAMRYVPFAALHDGSRWLAERFALAILTEAARDKLKDAPPVDVRVLGLGLTRAVRGFSALPAVEEELYGIVRDDSRQRSGLVPGAVALDEQFTRDALKVNLGGAFPIVHIASHFVFDAGSAQESYLLLGDGSKLTLQELQDEDFQFGGVDLLTLSACNTASGGADARGQEIEGFGALVQNLGASSVLATLWPVADASTARLMQELYRQRVVHSGTTKAEALRQAQLALLRQGPAPSGSERGAAALAGDTPAARQPPTWSHPYYWAPFILMGNWR